MNASWPGRYRVAVRRPLTFVPVIVAAALAGALPAGAHSCTAPVEIPVGEVTTVLIGVPAEQNPVVAVDVTIPEGFRLEEAAGVGPWRVERSGSILRYRGGELAPYACASFSLQGAAERQAALAFPITVRGPDGSELTFDGEEPGDPHAAQLVYAGFSPPAPDGGGPDGLSGTAIGAAVTVAVVGGAYLLSRRLQQRAPARPPRRRR
jgi:hypothetical protein